MGRTNSVTWERGRPARISPDRIASLSPFDVDPRTSPIEGDHRLWHSRGYLPHFDAPELVQTITFNLFDALPGEVVEGWMNELEISEGARADDSRKVELRRRIAAYEDEGHGSCFLGDRRIARIVEGALLYFDGDRYRLLAWCVMPNHVHVMAEIVEGHPLDSVMFSWKSYTAKKANRALGRTGGFWMPEYFDRFVRNETHLETARAYIEDNPVKAGLCGALEDWEWSSAARKWR